MKDDNEITIEDVRKECEEDFYFCCYITRIYLTSWLQHSESRHKNGHSPFPFSTYLDVMREIDLLDNAKLGVFDCGRLGGVEKVVNYLTTLCKL